MIDRFTFSGCLLLTLLVGVTLVSPGVVAQESSEVIDIGSRRELFVDHFLLERMVGTRLQLHHPEPAEAVLKVDQSWEGEHWLWARGDPGWSNLPYVLSGARGRTPF